MRLLWQVNHLGITIQSFKSGAEVLAHITAESQDDITSNDNQINLAFSCLSHPIV